MANKTVNKFRSGSRVALDPTQAPTWERPPNSGGSVIHYEDDGRAFVEWDDHTHSKIADCFLVPLEGETERVMQVAALLDKAETALAGAWRVAGYKCDLAKEIISVEEQVRNILIAVSKYQKPLAPVEPS